MKTLKKKLKNRMHSAFRNMTQILIGILFTEMYSTFEKLELLAGKDVCYLCMRFTGRN